MIPESVARRFWSHVALAGPDDCWEWTAFIDKHGYGRFSYNNQMVQTHRFSFTLAHGSIPPDHEVCHKCDNPKCCNPAHLFLGTHQDNMTDMKTKKRARTLATTTKITRTLKRQIREAYIAENVSQQELAARFGVHITTVSKIVRG
mgnify:CR=1 FL=1